MNYIKHGSLFVPERVPEVLRLFVDESYLGTESGTVQAGLLVSDDWYVREAIPTATELIAELGKTTKEFKASSLSKGNRSTYRSFLKLFTGGVASVGASGNACSIVTVNGREFHPTKYVDDLCRLITNTFAEYGVVTDPGITREFSWQLAWLGYHGSYLIKNRIGNALKMTFDSKHRYASIVREKVVVSKPGVGTMIWTRGELLKGVVNTPSIRNLLNVSAVEEFDFKWSHTEFGLQAADLFANFLHASLRYEKGIRNPATELRRELLQEVVTNASPDEQLLNALCVCGEQIACTKPELVSRCQLGAFRTA